MRDSRGGCGHGLECAVESDAVKEGGTGQGVPEEYGRCQGCKTTRCDVIVKKGTKGQSELTYDTQGLLETSAESTKTSVWCEATGKVPLNDGGSFRQAEL